MPTTLKKILNKLPSVKLDWKSYYLDQFKPLHGGVPVEHDSRLLFEDGWGYSNTEYRGPEYPPPEDPWDKWKLKCVYWALRKAEAERTLLRTRALLERLEDLQRARSGKVQQTTRHYDPELGTVVRTTSEVDIDSMNQRVTWLVNDVANSTEQLSQLQVMEKENGTPT